MSRKQEVVQPLSQEHPKYKSNNTAESYTDIQWGALVLLLTHINQPNALMQQHAWYTSHGAQSDVERTGGPFQPLVMLLSVQQAGLGWVDAFAHLAPT